MIRKVIQKAKAALPRKDYVIYQGSVLPAPHLRYCGPEFKDNSYYLESARSEAERLVNCCGCTTSSTVLDVGCGQGRLAIGLLRVVGEMPYEGLDVDQKSVDWCKKNIENNHPTFRFHHIDLNNARYNRKGKELDRSFQFKYPMNSFDIIYLYSVFSHMQEKDLRVYIADFARVLRSTGKLFFTAFVEENVPDVVINPEDYVFAECSGELHVVRYNKNYLFSVLAEYGFQIDNFSYRTETDNQSALYVSRKGFA